MSHVNSVGGWVSEWVGGMWHSWVQHDNDADE